HKAGRHPQLNPVPLWTRHLGVLPMRDYHIHYGGERARVWSATCPGWWHLATFEKRGRSHVSGTRVDQARWRAKDDLPTLPLCEPLPRRNGSLRSTTRLPRTSSPASSV